MTPTPQGLLDHMDKAFIVSVWVIGLSMISRWTVKKYPEISVFAWILLCASTYVLIRWAQDWIRP